MYNQYIYFVCLQENEKHEKDGAEKEGTDGEKDKDEDSEGILVLRVMGQQFFD